VKLSHYAGILILPSFLLACTTPEVILTGQREDLRSPAGQGAVDETATPAAVAVPISLPAPTNQTAWTHRAGSPTHRVPHLALAAAPQVIWSAKIGQGNDRKHRITAEPVLADGRIFTLDSRALVAAHSTAGAPLWTRDLTPSSDRSDDASGGGLAYGSGKLLVTSGFGSLSALDPASGAVIWTQKLDAPVSGAPTVVDGLVYVATRDNRAWAVDVENGRVRWQLSGTPGVSGIVGAASPAVTDRLAIFPFNSGELIGALRMGGVRVWNSLVTGERPGRAYSMVSDVTGEPVIANGIIYAGNTVGRTIAMNMGGERLWTAREGAIGPVWVTGGSVFLISDEAQLVRLNANTGERIWGVELPYYTKEKLKRRKAIYANFGPVLAGGKLWVACSDGQMRGFNPEDGTLVASVEIPGGAASRPIVVAGVAYIVTANGQLLALR